MESDVIMKDEAAWVDSSRVLIYQLGGVGRVSTRVKVLSADAVNDVETNEELGFTSGSTKRQELLVEMQDGDETKLYVWGSSCDESIEEGAILGI